MPEQSLDESLEQILAYDTPDDGNLFVSGVMREVRRENRARRWILLLFGAIGALFGVAGAVMLSDSIGWLFTEAVPVTRVMQAALFTAAAMAFYTWFMNDDLPIDR